MTCEGRSPHLRSDGIFSALRKKKQQLLKAYQVVVGVNSVTICGDT